jgi:hypothetical protein
VTRATATSRDATAGCFVCHGSEAYWRGPNAQAVAARHHDSTKHATWCDVYMAIRYGAEAVDPRQTDIEAAIAASSGGEALHAPLTVFDAPAGTAAGVSAPVGRSSTSALAAAPPEHPSS